MNRDGGGTGRKGAGGGGDGGGAGGGDGGRQGGGELAGGGPAQGSGRGHRGDDTPQGGRHLAPVCKHPYTPVPSRIRNKYLKKSTKKRITFMHNQTI